MKYVLLALVSGFCILPVLSQQNIVASGGDASGSNGSVSFTIGQIDYSNSSGSNGSTNEGVQQPFEFFDADASLQELGLNAHLYPNPTNEFVILQFENVPKETKYQLIDANGKLLTSGFILSEETNIAMLDYATGIYHLQLTQANKTTSIKIVKN